MPVTLGSTHLLKSNRLNGRRVGIVSNPASVDGAFTHIVDALMAAPGVIVAAIFGPQHGFRSDVQDNMIETPHAEDAERRVPVYSLYSDTREPTAEMLAGLDALVIDLQDIGARIYTYVYTMANCLRACARHGVDVIVCDRPNPIGGLAVEGPMLEAGYESFVGQFPLPMRHGMTIGELARMFNEHFGIGAPLEVVPLTGWARHEYADEAGAPWVMPSPNMPTLDTAIVYPGTVLFEGTMASEGRGTTRPFELLGAPWVRAERLAAGLNARRLPGVHFRPAVFEPTFQKHARTTCGGCQIHVLDRHAFQPVLTGVALIEAIRREDPARFAWRQPPYEYEHDKMPIDILAGSPALREAIDQGAAAEALAREWPASHAPFLAARERVLLYR
ncbi:MAG: exo-beta-N-acetylmuramidase NamZ domain-containing protein [Vicinamibacterales bacterium]